MAAENFNVLNSNIACNIGCNYLMEALGIDNERGSLSVIGKSLRLAVNSHGNKPVVLADADCNFGAELAHSVSVTGECDFRGRRVIGERLGADIANVSADSGFSALTVGNFCIEDECFAVLDDIRESGFTGKVADISGGVCFKLAHGKRNLFGGKTLRLKLRNIGVIIKASLPACY